MSGKREAMNEVYSTFFKKAYAPGTVTRGILDAGRPNTSKKWDAAGDIERSEAFADEYAQESIAAIDRLSSRRKNKS